MNRNAFLSRACLVVLAALLATSAHAVGTRDPLAFVAEFSGKVEVTRAASKAADPVTLGLNLRQGDKLQVGPTGSATLLFNDGNVLELPAKAALTIGARAGGKSDELMAGVFKSVSQGVVGGSRETGLVALAPVRGGAPAAASLILAPRQTELLEDKPSFRWRGVKGATRYRVMLSGDQGKVWEKEVTDTTLAFPPDATPLGRDADYTWSVDAANDAGSLRREESGFHVKSEAEAATVRQHLERIEMRRAADGHAGNFLAGAYLAGQGLLRDASERFETLCAGHPDEPGAHEALGRIYSAVGLTGEAAAELQKALTLTHKP